MANGQFSAVPKQKKWSIMVIKTDPKRCVLMPEYSHIQTYIKCDQFNFQDVIRLFLVVINSLGLDSRYFNSELEWEVSENGFMYVGGGAEPQLYHNKRIISGN
jgi:hypothetical protein